MLSIEASCSRMFPFCMFLYSCFQCLISQSYFITNVEFITTLSRALCLVSGDARTADANYRVLVAFQFFTSLLFSCVVMELQEFVIDQITLKDSPRIELSDLFNDGRISPRYVCEGFLCGLRVLERLFLLELADLLDASNAVTLIVALSVHTHTGEILSTLQ